MKIEIFSDYKHDKEIAEKEINIKIEKIAIDYKYLINNLNIIFMNDENLRNINKKHLNKETYTDVIAFNYSENENIIDGEIYISLERIEENAKKFNEEFYKELMRVIIHGMLHLVGEKDNSVDAKSRMTGREEFYLK